MFDLDRRVSKVSGNLEILLDKALSETKFRWYMLNNLDEIIAKYQIEKNEEKDLLYKIRDKMKIFVKDRLVIYQCQDNEPVDKITLESNENRSIRFKKANPNLTYNIAKEYSKNTQEE